MEKSFFNWNVAECNHMFEAVSRDPSLLGQVQSSSELNNETDKQLLLGSSLQ